MMLCCHHVSFPVANGHFPGALAAIFLLSEGAAILQWTSPIELHGSRLGNGLVAILL